jgi:hypothetical protein
LFKGCIRIKFQREKTRNWITDPINSHWTVSWNSSRHLNPVPVWAATSKKPLLNSTYACMHACTYTHTRTRTHMHSLHPCTRTHSHAQPLTTTYTHTHMHTSNKKIKLKLQVQPRYRFGQFCTT